MKIVCVVDSISDLNKKIEMLKLKFGNNIVFVVKASLEPIFKTFNYTTNAIYDKNLAKIIHLTLLKDDPTDTIVYYTSLKIDNQLLNNFAMKIGTKARIVNLMPKYNTFEKMCLGAYNIYVKSLFKNNDCLASPKLQFLPEAYMINLLSTHMGNKLFEMPKEVVSTLETEDKEINKSAKIKNKFGKSEIVFLISFMAISLALILTYALAKPQFIVAIIYVFAYILDILVYLILKCKSLFDLRFLK